jgi:hypothetical protein
MYLGGAFASSLSGLPFFLFFPFFSKLRSMTRAVGPLGGIMIPFSRDPETGIDRGRSVLRGTNAILTRNRERRTDPVTLLAMSQVFLFLEDRRVDHLSVIVELI